METSEVRPGLHMLTFTVGQAYLWCDDDGLTLIDSGPLGAGADIAKAVESLGYRRSDVRRVVVTHGHEDHTGGLPEITSWGEVTVLAHPADAPIIRGEADKAAPVLEDFERPIWDHVQAQMAGQGLDRMPPPVRVDREIGEGDVLEFGGGARILSVPGHTDGSIAVHLPEHGVLFTGDAVAARPGDGTVILGVFNTDRAQAVASLRRMAGLDVEVACFGHGAPSVKNTKAALEAAAEPGRQA